MEVIKKIRKVENTPSQNNSDVKFDPERAKKLREEKIAEQAPSLKERFTVNPAEYPIFAKQGGIRDDKLTGELKERQLSIDETLGLMVGATAKTIAVINGEEIGKPVADHVIYLDKSARPVSWLVEEFWGEFADRPEPKKSFLAIDRRQWLPKVNLELEQNEQIRDPDGTLRPATGTDFWRKFEGMPADWKKDILARIRALYIEDGIEDEDPDKIMSTPTILDGKNLLIVDEVSRSGSTLDIAKGLLQRAIPELKSVNGHVFWNDTSRENNQTQETQMGLAPVWYPSDHSIWWGRGIKDINTDFFRRRYENNPNKKTRAEMHGSFVLGEPLDEEMEPDHLSRKLRAEMGKMHRDYQEGHILPDIPRQSGVRDKIVAKMEALGVVFTPSEQDTNPNSRKKLMEHRNRDPKYDA